MTGTEEIRFSQGRLYVDRAVHADYFAGSETVILLRRDADLLVLPVRQAASGGYIMKIRNAAGDRVIDGADFFRDQRMDDRTGWSGDFAWCEKSGGLRLYEFFLM